MNALVIESQPQVATMLAQTLAGERLNVTHVASLAEAQRRLARRHVDLVLVEAELPDGSGIALANELRNNRQPIQTIILSNDPTLTQVIDAIRAGAVDYLIKPVAAEELAQRVRDAMERHRRDRQREQRARRLRRLCRKLDAARQEVTQQVDVLCNDLVMAYQELASQMQHAARASEYAGLIRDELDLEGLLRKTLEFLVQKAGPSNIAIFLPSTADEYTLGGYVNYDCTSESADVLLQHLADVVAPLMTDRTEPVHITDNQTLRQWIGDDQAYLADCHVLSFACLHQHETLAVVVLFRDGATPYTTEMVETAKAIAPMLGDYLARVIRIHHRHVPEYE
mgnify:CR=1 FL=1